MKKIKVVVFGCQQIAVEFIKYLSKKEGVEVPLVVTYELPLDKTYGYKSVLEEASKCGFRVMMPKAISLDIVRYIEEIAPDIIFSVYYRKIFPEHLLKLPWLGCVNIHPGLLPFYRGPVPTAWAIMSGESRFGITVHYMDKQIDTGDILIQEEYEILDNETGYELYTRAMELGANLLKENFHKIINQELTPRKQVGTGSYFGKGKWRYIIDWQEKAENIKNMVRVHARPYNPAETILLNRYVLINKATVINTDKYILQGPGKIIDIVDDKKIVVSCSDGFLRLDEYEIFPLLTAQEEEVYLKAGNRFG